MLNSSHTRSGLGEVAEIEAQMFSSAQMFNRRTAVEFSTEPAILPNCLLCLQFNKFILKDLYKFRKNKGRNKTVKPRWP